MACMGKECITYQFMDDSNNDDDISRILSYLPDIKITDATGSESCCCKWDYTFNIFSERFKINEPFHNSVYSTSDSLSCSSLGETKEEPIKPNYKRNTSHIKRIQIKPTLKFGGYGNENLNFLEPNSVAVTSNDKIIVADTNSHKIKTFDKHGNFLYKFGDAGKSPGKLLYPCKIALTPRFENLVIVQRNPMPQVQIFTQDGVFEQRFGSYTLKYPRALCVDENGRIIVIESKVMICHIFSPDGHYLRKLNLEKSLLFPYDVCAYNDEIYVSDNQSHCIKVFDYNGKLMRKIGENIINFPVSVELSNNNKSIVVADNHENFNINCFSKNGQLKSAFFSNTKHAQCYDIAVDSDNNVFLASKDYRIYGYRLPANSL